MATTSTTLSEQEQTSRGTKGPKMWDFGNLKPYVHPPETKQDLPWSELVTLDLEDYARPGGKERLANQLEHAVHHVGFFYVKNFGLTQEQIDRQFTLAQALFELPVEEKEQFEVNYAAADYNGWRRPFAVKNKKGGTSAFSNIEMYNSEHALLLLSSLCSRAHLADADVQSPSRHPILRISMTTRN